MDLTNFMGDKRMIFFKNQDKFYERGSDLGKYYNEPIYAPEPNITAIMLNISEKYFEFISERNRKMNFKKIPDGYIIDCNNKELFDMLEEVFISLNFAENAIEGFVNDMIPQTFSEYSYKKRNKNIFLNNRNDIIRLPLWRKIEELIPLIFGFIYNEDDKVIIQNFNDIIECRNNIVHPKTKNSGSVSTHMEWISKVFWTSLLDIKHRYAARNLIKLIVNKIYECSNYNPPLVPLEFIREIPTLEDFETF